MAEKKKSWFGRLFGGKKSEKAPAEVDIQDSAQATTEPTESPNEQIPAIESAPIIESPAPTIVAEEVPETVQAVLEEIAAEPVAEEDAAPETAHPTVAATVVEAIKEEFEEAFVPHKKDNAHDTAAETHSDVIQTQHHFLEEIVNDAVTETEEASRPIVNEAVMPVSEPIVEEVTPVAEPIVEEITPVAEAIVEEITPVAEPIVEKITPVAETIVEEVTPVTEPIVEKVTPVTEPIVEEVTPVAEPIVEEITPVAEPIVEEIAEETVIEEDKPKKKAGFFARLSSKLAKTRNNLTEGIADLFLGKKEISEEILEELETRLLMADVGINVTDQMLTSIRDSVSRKSLSNVDELFAALKKQMREILAPVDIPLTIDNEHRPYVILMIGVNGVGKTTTIGKLAKKFQAEGKSVMLAAGDTFRAAAVEQLEIWGERNKIPVISQKEGADPASVIFDAMASAKAKKVDILIADTAGRLHTDSGLMQELAKINRVMKRHDESAPHEVMLVVDASTGQNALNQARQFNATVPLSGITFTKLDGTAKGGIIFAIAEELKIPIRFIGVGESIDDLRPFDATEFVDALIDTKNI